jgi:hypothetical protein
MSTALTPAPNLPGLTFVPPRDPAALAFPPMLAMELAMRVDSPSAICRAYGLTRDDLAALIAHPVFIRAYQEALEALKVDGMSFKVKARLQAEEYLGTAFAMVQNPATGDAVRADIIKNTVRWAGYDAKAAEVGGNANFNIVLNLG